MKLRISIEDPSDLIGVIGVAVGVAKSQSAAPVLLILSFEPECVLLSAFGGGVWAQIEPKSFGGEYLVTAKSGKITLQIYAQDFLNILIAYKNSISTGGDLKLRLQYAQQIENSSRKNYNLSFSFLQEGGILNSFDIPVNLLRDPPQFTTPKDIQLTMAFDSDFLTFLRRCERYRGFDYVTLSVTDNSSVAISMANERKSVTLQWRNHIEIRNSEGGDDFDPLVVKIKPKSWNVAIKMLELASTIQLIIHKNGCVFSSYVNDNHDYLLLYYIPGILNPISK